RLIKLQAYGRLDYRPGFNAATDSSLYDLASLTKVIGTTTAAMILADEGKLDLNAPISRYLPEFLDHPDKTNITVRNLLLHNAGFRAFAPLYRTAKGREQYLKGILDLPLDYQTGARMVYSDFSMITLALAMERVSGQPIDQFLQQRVFGPLGMRDTRYNPDASILYRIAPTEIDTIFRKTHVHGVVHDENAFAIGGVSGHAGLFSSARDLAKFGQMLLNGGYYGGRRYISPATVSQFTKRQGEQSSRGLGWDTNGNKFGHTGFTGTSIWADPENQVLIVLLTNRVNPTRDNQKIAPLRRAVAEAVANSIRD
ncbi:MAG TPA: serine hydrolase, partial [Longimicrobiales bacterium]|nr:serine hydrolase [Longimicrobiales bacterium]